jgi:hypothetical protein
VRWHDFFITRANLTGMTRKGKKLKISFVRVYFLKKIKKEKISVLTCSARPAGHGLRGPGEPQRALYTAPLGTEHMSSSRGTWHGDIWSGINFDRRICQIARFGLNCPIAKY